MIGAQGWSFTWGRGKDRREAQVKVCSGSEVTATSRRPGVVRRAGVNRVGSFPAFQSIVLKNCKCSGEKKAQNKANKQKLAILYVSFMKL